MYPFKNKVYFTVSHSTLADYIYLHWWGGSSNVLPVPCRRQNGRCLQWGVVQGPKSTGKRKEKGTPGVQLGSLLTIAMLTLACSLLLAIHLWLQYSSWDFLLLFLLIHLEGKTLCLHELKSPVARAQSSITLKAQQRAHCMPTSLHPFQAFPFRLMKGAYKLPRNILKCEHEEVTEGFRRGHKPDQ